MSQLYVDSIKNRTGGAIGAPNGVVVTGVVTATKFVGSGEGLIGVASTDNIVTGTAATFNNTVNFGSVCSISTSGNSLNINSTDTISISGYSGGTKLLSQQGSNLVVADAIGGDVELYFVTSSGANGSEKRLETTTNGIAVAGIVTATSGIVTYYGDGSNLTGISVGLTTEALVANNSVVTLDLTKQDHKITATGICTITVTGGTEANSHTVRLINSGIATVGFSTYFLFPSGATPSLPEADGSISLLSFTVNRVGAGGTQLLTGASLNYS